jgi:hypothetical protein
MRLVEESEAHVVVGLLLLLLLLLLGGSGLGSATSSGTAGSGGGTTTTSTGWDRGELGGTLRDQLRGVSNHIDRKLQAGHIVPR